jgi:hypothetical protein
VATNARTLNVDTVGDHVLPRLRAVEGTMTASPTRIVPITTLDFSCRHAAKAEFLTYSE